MSEDGRNIEIAGPDALLSLFEHFVHPDDLRTLFAVIGSWLEEAPDPVVIEKLDTHAEIIWRALMALSEDRVPQKQTGGLTWEPLSSWVDTLCAEDQRRLKDLEEGQELIIRIYQSAGAVQVAFARRSQGAVEIGLPSRSFRPLVRELFHETFTITESEMDIVELLANGAVPADIAEHRGTSIDTVRNQIKSITNKVGASRQQDVIRIYKDIEIRVVSSGQVPNVAEPRAGTERILETGDGRQIAYDVYGDPGGEPILYSHCLTSGRHWSAQAIEIARDNGFRIISPSRAGFGASTMNEKTGIALLDDHVRDYAQIIRAETTPDQKVSLFCFGSGMASAFRFALANPEKVRAVVAINMLPPILSIRDTKMVKGMFKPAALAALLAPPTLRLMTSVAARRYNTIGEDVEDLHFIPGFNLRELEEEDGIRVFIQNIADGAVSKGDAYWREASYTAVDWAFTPEGANYRPDVLLLETQDSPLTVPGSNERFVERTGARVLSIPQLFPFLTSQLPYVADMLHGRSGK